MKLDNMHGFGNTRVEWSIDSSSDEMAVKLNQAIQDAIDEVKTE